MELAWKEDKVLIEEVKTWIKHVTGATKVIGPTEIYRSNDWGITAKFQADNEEVVCKVGFLPLFKTSPSIYELLNDTKSESVPKLLHAEFKNEQTWMLFEKFSGKPLKEDLSLPSIKETAKTIANIQNDVIERLQVSDYEIPKISSKTIADVCLQFVSFVKEKYAPIWANESSNIAEEFQINEDKLIRLGKKETYDQMKKSIKHINTILSKEILPLSLFHLDLHTGNVVTQSNNEQLIYDWEEAIITIPFFSLSKLLNEVPSFNTEENPKDEKHLLDWKPAEQVVIETYLNELNFGANAIKLETFDLAMCLAPIIYAKQSLQFIEQVGWGEDAAGFLAYDFIIAYERMQQVSEKGEINSVLYDS